MMGNGSVHVVDYRAVLQGLALAVGFYPHPARVEAGGGSAPAGDGEGRGVLEAAPAKVLPSRVAVRAVLYIGAVLEPAPAKVYHRGWQREQSAHRSR